MEHAHSTGSFSASALLTGRMIIPLMIILLVTAAASHAQIYDNILWTTNGVPICTAADTQYYHHITTDGAGGAIVVWEDKRATDDSDIYAQRVDIDGNVQWTTDGVAVCNDSDYQILPAIIDDGAGGAVIAWCDYQSGTTAYDIYAQRLNASGTALWTAGGVDICSEDNNQTYPRMCSDGQGGTYFAWVDARYGYDDYDIYAQRVDADGNLQWYWAGINICSEYQDQSEHQIVADGTGGAIIAWIDFRDSLDNDIYAQKIDANGYILWTTNGTAVCNDPYTQYYPRMTSDGAGGAIIAWEDYRPGTYSDIYAQRIDSTGNAVWTANGVAICNATDDQQYPLICSDQQGGAIIAWRDKRSGDTHSRVYAQRVDALGNRLWQTNGIPMAKDSLVSQYVLDLISDDNGGAIICVADNAIRLQRISAYGDTLMPAKGTPVTGSGTFLLSGEIASDEPGSAIVSWIGYNFATDFDIYAQKVNMNPQPLILSVEDIGQDQGRQVSLIWERSYYDDSWDEWISKYSIWRRYPSSAKAADMGREWSAGFPWDQEGKIYRLLDWPDRSDRGAKEAWEYIGYVDAHHLDQYAFTAPTLEDSSASGTPYFFYFVSAHTADPQVFYDSAPDSGYSVDDIGPAATVLSLTHDTKDASKGSLQLSWEEVTTGTDGSPETGPINYNVYCDTTAWFTPTAGNVLTSTQNLSYNHSDARIGDPTANLFYLVTAVDGSGNQSEASNRTGESDCQLKTTTGTDYTWTTLCLGDTSLAMASDLEAYIEAHSSPATNCLSVSQWNPVAQAYTSYTTVPIPMGDFALAPGHAYRVEVTSDAVWTLAGEVLPVDSVTFQLKTTTGTDYTWISVPLHLDTLAMASNLEAHIQGDSDPATDCLSISEWNPVAQAYTSYTTIPIPMGDFAIQPGQPYRVEVTADALWPYAAKGARQFQRKLHTR